LHSTGIDTGHSTFRATIRSEDMSKKTNSKETPAAKTEAKVDMKPASKQQTAAGPVVYCGPSVRGIVRQYTVFTGNLPDALNEFVGEHPLASALIVPTERFADMRQKLETAGTAEAILYRQLKSELK